MKLQKTKQIVALLYQFDAALGKDKTIEDICWEKGISPATYHHWKQKYGGLSIQDAKRFKELELENAKLKHLLAESMLANDALLEFISKSITATERYLLIKKWRTEAYPDFQLANGQVIPEWQHGIGYDAQNRKPSGYSRCARQRSSL